MRLRAAVLALLLCAAVAPAGCGLSSPSDGTTTPTSPAAARVAHANATHEYSSQQPPPPQTAVGSASAVEAVSAFAEVYTNWTADTVGAHLHALAAASIGQARSAMQLAAAGTTRDYELRRAGIANTGTVASVAALSGSPNRFVVVTRERTTALASPAYQGLRPAWHVTVASVTQLGPGVWVVSGWQPET